MLSSDANTTTLGVHARGHVHGRKLLEHELSGVWDDDLCDFGLVLARSALELILLERAGSALVNIFSVLARSEKNLRNGSHQTANLANVDTESIRNVKQSLLQESRGTVSDHTIALHLSETQTTITCSTFHRLTS
jgi:hypothetical protein